MEDEETLHEIFRQNPIELMSFVDCFVKILLENGEIITGTVYTIDPVSQSVVVFTKEKSGDLTMKIVLKLSIKSMEKLTDVPEDQKILTSELFKSEKSNSPTYTKEDVIRWLEKNMIPVVENDDKLLIDSLEIHPPYGIEQCYCSNSIVLLRIQNLLSQMPPKS